VYSLLVRTVKSLSEVVYASVKRIYTTLRLSALVVDLSTRNTPADILLDIDGTSAMVK